MSAWKVHPEIDYYFCTNTVVEWYPIFLENRYFDIVVESLTYCKNSKGLRIHAVCNHVKSYASTYFKRIGIICFGSDERL